MTLMRQYVPAMFALHVSGASGGETAGAPESEQRCGDAVCDGPENAANCPEDCAAASGDVSAATPDSPCDLPNPQRAVVSAELLTYRNVVEDIGQG